MVGTWGASPWGKGKEEEKLGGLLDALEAIGGRKNRDKKMEDRHWWKAGVYSGLGKLKEDKPRGNRQRGVGRHPEPKGGLRGKK